MDTFIDKLAQRFSAQDMIRANLAAEAKETRKLREKMESYESLLQEMRQINLKNMESAERVNRILQEGTFTDKEYLQKLFAQKEEVLRAELVKIEEAAAGSGKAEEAIADYYAKTEESINAGFAKMDEALHTENVKVYRNVQAAIQNSIDEQTKKLLEEQQKQIEEQHKLIQEQGTAAKKRGTFLKVMAVLTFLGVIAEVVLHVLEMMNFKFF